MTVSCRESYRALQKSFVVKELQKENAAEVYSSMFFFGIVILEAYDRRDDCQWYAGNNNQ